MTSQGHQVFKREALLQLFLFFLLPILLSVLAAWLFPLLK